MAFSLWKGVASVFRGENASTDEKAEWTHVTATHGDATLVYSVTPKRQDLTDAKRIVTIARAHDLNCRLRIFDRNSFVDVVFETAEQVGAFRDALDANQIEATFELHVSPVHA